jgi:hypothetical protein
MVGFIKRTGVGLVDFTKSNLLAFLEKVNTTGARIVSTIILSAITGVRVLFLDKWLGDLNLEILIAWLTFLGALGGLDYLQFAKKRTTYIPPANGTDTDTTAAIATRRQSGEHTGVEATP